MLLVACGQGADGGEPAGPSVADLSLGGDYRVAELAVDGDEVAVDELLEVELDAEFGGLRIETACGVLLGSFSLLPDGQAGFTVAGGSDSSCSGRAADQRDALIGALGRIDGWAASTSGIDLESPAGDRLSLSR